MKNNLIPFAYGDNLVRVIEKDGQPWWVAKDVCNVLGLENARDTIAKMLDEDEKGAEKVYTPGGEQEMNIINESGLYNLIFRSNKPEAKAFRKWVSSEVLPQIRQAGVFGAPELEGHAYAGEIYSLFSSCQDMTIQRINRIIFYFALTPPLSNIDISKLLDVTAAIVAIWRKRLNHEMAQKAVKVLGINAHGVACGQARPKSLLHQSAEKSKSISPEITWIRSQLKMRRISQAEVAKQIDRDRSTVSAFLRGEHRSKAIEGALAKSLGYISFDALWADAVEAVGGVA